MHGGEGQRIPPTPDGRTVKARVTYDPSRRTVVINPKANLARVQVLGSLAALVVAGLLGWWWIRRSLRPLGEVSQAAAHVAHVPMGSGEVSLAPYRVRRELAEPGNEVGDVGFALNQLIGSVDVAIEQRGKKLIAHYTQADPVKASITQGTLQAFIDAANIAATGEPPAYTFDPQKVEDDSLTTIQYVTPGLLGCDRGLGRCATPGVPPMGRLLCAFCQ